MRALIIERLASLPAPESPQAAAGLREAAVLVPLVDRPGGMTIVLVQRTQHLRHHPGQISFPGGGIEPADDGPVAAALRETQEEIGIAREHIEVVGQLEPIVTGTGFHITPIVGFVAANVELTIDPFEVESVFEVPLAFVLDPRHHEVRTRQFEGKDVSYYVLDYEGRNIWGATARILVNLARHLGAAGTTQAL
jgi:8-oxo-dGTP pyrophosphatase MutT (NUDIX family)